MIKVKIIGNESVENPAVDLCAIREGEIFEHNGSRYVKLSGNWATRDDKSVRPVVNLSTGATSYMCEYTKVVHVEGEVELTVRIK